MLTAIEVKNAKPREKAYKMTDAFGLHLFISPSGGKLWRFKYRYAGKEKLLSFGPYPVLSLADARERLNEARKQISQGIDPGAVKRAQKAVSDAGDSFEIVAREWHGKIKTSWSPDYGEMVMARLQNDVFPWLGSRPCGEIRAPELLACLRRIEDRGAVEMSHRTKTICSQIFRYAVATGRAESDPSLSLKGALAPKNVKHYPALTDPAKFAGLLRAIDGYEGSLVVKSATKFSALVFCRPGEARHAEWPEIDFENALWTIPAAKIKMRVDHLVPLSRQAIAILEEIKPLTGGGKYVFPCHSSKIKPLSENGVLGALRRLGFTKEEMTGHGFRAIARTILDEVLQVRPDFIEHQLAHAVRDPNGRSYNRTQFLDERRKMMQLWADYIDGLKAGAKVIPFPKQANGQ